MAGQRPIAARVATGSPARPTGGLPVAWRTPSGPGRRYPRAMRWLLDLFMPPRCAVRGCGRPGAWLCDACAAGIVRPGPGACGRCLDATADPATGLCERCASGAHAFERVHAAGLHEPPLRDLVHALKYRRVRPVASELAALISITIPVLDPRSVVVPVPSHRRRVRARGVDAAGLIGRRLAARRGLEFAPRLIERVRYTAPQVMRDHASRSANVRSAFRVGAAVEGRRVILVDDVLTTGATSNECASALLACGAESVTVAVAARATTADRRGGRPSRRL